MSEGNKVVRTAFYPCCGKDFEYPSQLLDGLVDRIIFCDIRAQCAKHLDRYDGHIGRVSVEFIAGDVQEVVERMSDIAVFFYRGDSRGEGGSGVYVLGKKFFGRLAERLMDGALIITDGHNSGDKLLQRMLRPEGYVRFGKHYSLKSGVHQPNEEGLYTIYVKNMNGSMESNHG
jgi:hypothetical protein